MVVVRVGPAISRKNIMPYVGLGIPNHRPKLSACAEQLGILSCEFNYIHYR